MLPATTVARPAARQRAPVSAVTVDLPFEPVIASTFCSGGSARAKSSMSPTSSAPRATAAAIAGWLLGDAGADRDEVGAGERGRGERSRGHRHVRQRRGEIRGERRRGPRVRDAHDRAVRREMAREREPGEPESQHDGVASGVVRHLSFSVERPNRTSSIVMIQKRTTTWFSFQPLSS